MSSAALEAAFRATTYRVATPEGFFFLRIGIVDSAFDDFLLRYGAVDLHLATDGAAGRDAVMCWGIVTAHNPGRLLTDDENRLRHRRLYERIIVSGWRLLEASNIADAAAWPMEPGYLVLRANAEQLRALGQEFGQLAVLFGRTGSAPELLWL